MIKNRIDKVWNPTSAEERGKAQSFLWGEVKNKTGTSIGYSDYAYDVKGATINNVVYPSIDPMIFELKYPNTDIQGRVVPL